MKNYKIIIIISISLLIFVGLYFYYCDLDKSLGKTSEILKILFSFVTLIIALKIYDRFGLNKKIAEKRTELIVDLLIELKNKSFRIDVQTNGKRTNMLFLPKKNIYNYLQVLSKDQLNSKVFFLLEEKENLFKKIELIENHPLLPKAIRSKLEFLTVKSGFRPEINPELHTAQICYSNEGVKKLEDKKLWFIIFNNNCSLKEYLIKYQSLFEEIDKWINKYSNLSDELNI